MTTEFVDFVFNILSMSVGTAVTVSKEYLVITSAPFVYICFGYPFPSVLSLLPSIGLRALNTATTMSLKLLIDTKGQRVLYAEAGKDFVDFLFNILLLPVGTFIKLLRKEGMVGCLANLYESVENLGDAYIQPTTNKDTLLNPKSSSLAINVPLLSPNIQSSKPQIIPASFVLRKCSNTYMP
ncbi:hypothetical protein Gotur_036049 [Gossypium turneri]